MDNRREQVAASRRLLLYWLSHDPAQDTDNVKLRASRKMAILAVSAPTLQLHLDFMSFRYADYLGCLDDKLGTVGS